MARNLAPNITTRNKVKNTLNLGCWNVRTITPGLSTDLQTISDLRKTSILNKEFLRLHVDIAALQETQLPDSSSLKEIDYTFLWQGKKAEEPRKHGVGFAVKNTFLDKVQLGHTATERLMSLVLNTTDGPIILLCVYAPTLTSPDKVKDEFYSSFESIIRTFSKDENLIILGDFNARVGSEHGQDLLAISEWESATRMDRDC